MQSERCREDELGTAHTLMRTQGRGDIFHGNELGYNDDQQDCSGVNNMRELSSSCKGIRGENPIPVPNATIAGIGVRVHVGGRASQK
jgi:hypothetical protein